MTSHKGGVHLRHVFIDYVQLAHQACSGVTTEVCGVARTALLYRNAGQGQGHTGVYLTSF